MLALTLITFISFVDDIRSTSQILRLVFHFSAMALMFYQWGLFSLPWWTLFVALIVCTGIINAYNFMDGINGITGGYSLVVLVALAYINEAVVSFVEQDFILTVLCSVVVFNFFNFRKRAKCFAGDVGSVCIAFVLLFFIGKLVIRTEDFSWIILLAVYGVDSVLTIKNSRTNAMQTEPTSPAKHLARFRKLKKLKTKTLQSTVRIKSCSTKETTASLI